jgi:RNA 2',3'-cyclic 3'-phosphodiesterase
VRPQMAPREATRRLFFALWPDEAMRRAMADATCEAARASGGRPVPAANLHVTLAFLGAVPERQLPALAEAAAGSAAVPAAAGAAARGEPLELAFDHLELWRAAQLLCAAPAAPPMPCAALAGRLQARLAERGFAPDLKSSGPVGPGTTRPFRPHVTLARKVQRPLRAMEMDPVSWRFADFVLVDSKTLPEGPVYSVLERFPLDH